MSESIKEGWKTRRIKHHLGFMISPLWLCECNCGEIVYGGSKFIDGHNTRGIYNPFYGKHHTEENKTHWRIIRKGTVVSEKTKKIKSEQMIGNKFALGMKHSESQKHKWSEERSGIGNSMYGKKCPWIYEAVRKREELYKQNPDLHPNRIMAQKGFISKPQLKLFEIIKQHFPDAELELPIRTQFGLRFADVGVPSLKTDFEYNGSYWHNGHESEDQRRTLEIQEAGWNVVEVNEEQLRGL